MGENRWSPFDPEWYKYAFDKFISTAEQLFYQNEIIAQGYVLPDSDGAKSSVFRRNAVLNNSFNEGLLRETLKDIYLNSSYKLTASNHDNVHFFQWAGYMHDMNLVSNTKYCEINIPTENFISSDMRERYKKSQFYRKWVSITELIQNWDDFKWILLLFVNQRVYSEYMLRMDDQVCCLRFKYEQFWLDRDYSVYIYKFDANYCNRIKIAKETVANPNRWNWKINLPEYYKDEKVLNYHKVVAYFNRIADPDDRENGRSNVDAMGDNLEFLSVDENGVVDLSGISDFNKTLIQSEHKEWVWMTIFVPKFMHEFPIPLATDVVYRPYNGKYNKLWTLFNGEYHEVKADLEFGKQRNVYINLDEKMEEWDDGWKYMIRPVVLSDAFDTQCCDPYSAIEEKLNNLNDLIIQAMDSNEELHLFMAAYTTDEEFLRLCDKVEADTTAVYDAYTEFINSRNIDENTGYNELMIQFNDMMQIAREQKSNYSAFMRQYSKGNDIWIITSELLDYSRELISRYDIIDTLHNIDKDILWEDELTNQLRFRRPVDASDFWTFKFYPEEKVWRPYVLNVEHHFPDVYTFTDGEEVTPNEVYKTFFFYSDTMNVRELTSDIVKASPSWDNDMEEFMYDRGATYRDIFMEKFYWMGVRAIYKGILVTKYRWEVLEYIQDNASYERFNQLFMNTMDPYFKMGLATYLKSPDFAFPFDYAVDKMNEAINQQFLGYQRVSNYEIYLDKTWSPSYFDFVTDIMDGWDYEPHLVRRPSSTFDTTRLFSIIKSIQGSIKSESETLNSQINDSLEKITEGGYILTEKYLRSLSEMATSLDTNMADLFDFINNLDMDIYSIDDVNTMADMFRKHLSIVDDMRDLFGVVYDDAVANSHGGRKRELLDCAELLMSSAIVDDMNAIKDNLLGFDITHFMYGVNNPDYFNEKEHDDDNSVIGRINHFLSSWSKAIQSLRNKLYESTVALWTEYNGSEQYTSDRLESLILIMKEVQLDINALKEKIYAFWNIPSMFDINLVAHFDFATEYIQEGIEKFEAYSSNLETLINDFESIKGILSELESVGLTTTETTWVSSIYEYIDSIIAEMSHLDIKSHSTAADEYKEAIDSIFAEWDIYNANENDVFNDIISYTEAPTTFILAIGVYKDIIGAIIDYIGYCNKEFIPDESLPNYSDLYQVTDIELVSGGFGHNVGEEVYVPYVGVYRIISVTDDDIRACTGLELVYQDTMFRNPVNPERYYYSATSGTGLGIIIKAIASKEIRIINDSVTEPYIEKVKNIIYLVNRDKTSINPYNNDSVESTMEKVDKLSSDWNNLLSFYRNYMSEPRVEGIQNMIDTTSGINVYLQQLIDTRDRVDFNNVMVDINTFIVSTYELYQSRHKITPNYLYFDNRLRAVYDELLVYYDNGTNWNDEEEMLRLFDKIEYELQLFKRLVLDKTLGPITDPDNAHIIELYDTIFNDIDGVKDALYELPSIIDNLDSTINDMEVVINDVPEAVVDEWYRATTYSVATGGNGYLVGDIAQLVVEDESPMFVQVSNIDDNGSVTGIRLLMNYALPKQMYGSYHTIASFGSGDGLIVNIVTAKVGKNDSTYFLDPSSDETKPDQFDDNDLFAFRFENIHDLPIGYEVFIAGAQFTDYIIRHEGESDNLNPSDIDTIYLNANQIMNLQNSAVRINGENYFVYKIDNVELLNPGKGYTKGQDIVVDAGQVALKLNVTKLKNDPYKSIDTIDLAQNYTLFNGSDPKSDEAVAINDSSNNIDDEYNDGYYDHLTSEGILKPLTRGYPIEEYSYTSQRFDDLEDGLRNKNYMYGPTEMPDTPDAAKDGDPDEHNYLGSRIDNSQVPYEDERRWDGIEPIIPHIDSFIPDSHRLPPDQYIAGEFQEISHIRIFNTGLEDTNEATSVFVDGVEVRHVDTSEVRDQYNRSTPITRGAPLPDEEVETHVDEDDTNDIITSHAEPTRTVDTHADLPQHIKEWREVEIGDTVAVRVDEKYGNHRMLYTVRSFMVTGYIIYDAPEEADLRWNYFDVDWMVDNFYPDMPTVKAQYPDANWKGNTYQDALHDIEDGSAERKFTPIAYPGTYIHDITVDDISVYNFTEHKWEDLHDTNKWRLEVRNDEVSSSYGFRLYYLEEGIYSYDMKLFLNKVPNTQIKNAALKENAVFKISSYIYDEVDTKTMNLSVNTGRRLRIRKLFPYEQKEEYKLNSTTSHMTFKIANYKHYKNELHLEDVKIFNKTAGRFEDLFNQNMFEVRFKDQKAVERGYETNTEIVQAIITDPGSGFTNGDVWAWNEEFQIQVFGQITADYLNDGTMLTFTPIHCPNPPTEDIALEFQVYQHAIQWNTKIGQAIIEFQTTRSEVHGDGYIHNVTNRMAPLPKEFMVIVKYDIEDEMEYELSINKNPQVWEFVKDDWEVFPTFTLPDVNIQQDRIYITNDKGRIPLVNPSTGKPSMVVMEKEDSTDVLYMNLYSKFEHLQIHAVPYPMRSVYVQRRVPKNGYIDVGGKINKPLNKKYFEFWMNGRLLSDEVTIISPTKIFLHGLKSLRNFEIIEINRDTNEFFADNFLGYEISSYDSPYPKWNLKTYIDDALEGTLEGDNYTTEEQESLLTPVWKQVERDHPEFKNYPPNLDTEADILLRVDSYSDMSGVASIPYQFAVIDVPTIEGIPINSRAIKFTDFGFEPITNNQIIGMLDEEWKDEIIHGDIDSHTIISDDEWYGMVTRLYDEYGMLVHTLDESAYQITDDTMLRINTDTRITRITKLTPAYDLD